MKMFYIIIFFVININSFEIEKYAVDRNGSIIDIDVVNGEVIVEIEENKKDEIIKKLNDMGYTEMIKLHKNFYIAKATKPISFISSFSDLSFNNIKAYPNLVFRHFYFSDDPYISKQWYLSRINAFSAWDFDEYKSTVTVFVVDSGVDDSHEDLWSVLYSTQINVDINNQSVIIDPSPFSLSGSHGTAVSGTISAINNNLKGISGVSRNIKIYSVNVFYGGTGLTNLATVIKALDYIKNNLSLSITGKRIINMSLGAQADCDSAIQSILNELYTDGFIIIAASGNNAMDVATPANCDNVIPVSATDGMDKLAWFSNYGDKMLNGLSAPGVSIFTTFPGNNYEYVDGTSFSAPITSAVMGMVWAKRPELKNSQVISLVKKTAYDIDGNGSDKKYGWGRVDVFKVLSYLESNLDSKGVDKDFVAWPNPFSVLRDGFIKFSVKDSIIYPDDKLMIFDFAGNFIANVKKDGINGFMWDGRNEFGVIVSPGPYVGYYKSPKGHARTKFLLTR